MFNTIIMNKIYLKNDVLLDLNNFFLFINSTICVLVKFLRKCFSKTVPWPIDKDVLYLHRLRFKVLVQDDSRSDSDTSNVIFLR